MNFEREEIKFALEVVKRACRVTKLIQQELTNRSIIKEDKSPVTVGDFAAQAIVGKFFAEKLPADILVGEEGSELLRGAQGQEILNTVLHYVQKEVPDATGELVCEWVDRGNGKPCERFWTLDPIDGTKGFMRGEQYAVGLSLMEEGRVVLGVIGCPNLALENTQGETSEGIVAAAYRGEGTWVSSLKPPFDFKKVQVSEKTDITQMTMLRSVESRHTHAGRTLKFSEDLKITSMPIFMDSQAKYVMVAMGRGDCFFYLVPESRPQSRMKIWDVAPGAIVIEEAGGKITDVQGNELDYTAGLELTHNPGLVISNGSLHEKILSGLTQVLNK